jgi:hypothetical protein
MLRQCSRLSRSAQKKGTFGLECVHQAEVDEDACETISQLALFGDKTQLYDHAQAVTHNGAHDFHHIASLYSPTLFSFGLFDSAEITYKMALAGLVDEPVAKTIPRWLVSPAGLARDRTMLSRKLGPEREKGFCEVLKLMLSEFDRTISPLQRHLNTTNLNAEVWTSFLRGAASVAVFQATSALLIPGVVRACIDGEIADSRLQIEGDNRDRAAAVGQLLIETSAEYGSPPLTNLALEIFAKYHLSCSFQVMRRIQQCFVRSSKRQLDWQLRQSGELKSIAPLWFRDYFPSIMKPSTQLQGESITLPCLEVPPTETVPLGALQKQTLMEISGERVTGAPMQVTNETSNIASYFSKAPTSKDGFLDRAIERDAAVNSQLASKVDGSNQSLAHIYSNCSSTVANNQTELERSHERFRNWLELDATRVLQRRARPWRGITSNVVLHKLKKRSLIANRLPLKRINSKSAGIGRSRK